MHANPCKYTVIVNPYQDGMKIALAVWFINFNIWHVLSVSALPRFLQFSLKPVVTFFKHLTCLLYFKA